MATEQGAPRRLPAGLGQPIKGPSALGTDAARLWRLTWTLATTEFKLKFFGSALGYLWQLMRPLLLFGVLFIVFTKIVNLGAKVQFYGIALLLGIVMFGFLAEGTSGAVRSLVDRENLVRKIEFPRLAVPASTVLTALFNLAVNLVPVFVFFLVSGGSVRLSWLEMIPIVAFLAVLVLGLAMILSVGYVSFRDVAPIWDVVLQAAFYASPVLVPVQAITSAHGDLIARLLMLNPFGAALQQARHAVIGPSQPSAAAAADGAIFLIIPIVITFAVFAFGLWLFDRAAPRIAERL